MDFELNILQSAGQTHCVRESSATRVSQAAIARCCSHAHTNEKGAGFHTWGIGRWLRHCATSREVAGSRPDEVTELFQFTYPLGFTQPLTEMSTRSKKKIFLESRARPVSRADNLTAICEPIV
jgi:hypothetical protein